MSALDPLIRRFLALRESTTATSETGGTEEAKGADIPTALPAIVRSPPYVDTASGKLFQMAEIEGKSVFFITTDPLKPDSFIPIGIEMYFHVTRYLKGLLPDTPPEPLSRFINEAFAEVLQKIYADADLQKLLRIGNSQEINAYIDKNRVKYLTDIVLNEVFHIIQRDELPVRSDWTHYIPEHTAGNITVVKENSDRSLSVIEMCEQSSHSKKHELPAIVPIRRHLEDGTLESMVFRCPSLVDSDRLNVTEQIVMLTEKRRLEMLATPTDRRESPMIYNLLTSFVQKTADLGNNQTETAMNIFASAHQFNRRKLNGDGEYQEDQFFIPMNIPVNQLSYPLDINRGDTGQALILAHLAIANSTLSEMIHRIEHTNPRAVADFKEAIKSMNEIYQRFLTSGKSHMDKATRMEFLGPIATIKNAIPKLFLVRTDLFRTEMRESKAIAPATYLELLQTALLKIFYLKFSPEHIGKGELRPAKDQLMYGSLIQALHLATSTGNVSGCKSANDRFGLIYALAETLKSQTPEIRGALENVIIRGEKTDLEAFALAVHRQNNDHHLYGAGFLPSTVDVGAPKYRVSSNPKSALDVGGRRFFGLRVKKATSYDFPSIYTNLKSSNAGKTQYHNRTGLKSLIKNKPKKFLEALLKSIEPTSPPARSSPALAFAKTLDWSASSNSSTALRESPRAGAGGPPTP